MIAERHRFSMVQKVLLCALPLLAGGCALTPVPKPPSMHLAKVLTSEMLFDQASFASCHASTIIETENRQFVAAWFGGTAERKPDVGIWLARRIDGAWTAPVEVANGIQPPNIFGLPVRYPTWNPVLFQSAGRPLMLFYKVGRSPGAWWGMVMFSTDDGKTWSQPQRLLQGLLGPIKDKAIQLPNGSIIAPSSDESWGWTVHFELSADGGESWKKVSLAANQKFGAIQPTILVHPSDAGDSPKLQALCRTREQFIAETWSTDGGTTWTPLAATSLPNPNAGIDAVTLADGRYLLVYNPTTQGRTPLTVAVSRDGKAWKDVLTLEDEPGEYSYPAIIQSRDGAVHITYTYRRDHIKHVVLDPQSINSRTIETRLETPPYRKIRPTVRVAAAGRARAGGLPAGASAP